MLKKYILYLRITWRIGLGRGSRSSEIVLEKRLELNSIQPFPPSLKKERTFLSMSLSSMVNTDNIF